MERLEGFNKGLEHTIMGRSPEVSDRYFTRNVGRTEDADAIASALAAIAHILGQRVMAEGVETTEQLAFWQQHQCNAI